MVIAARAMLRVGNGRNESASLRQVDHALD